MRRAAVFLFAIVLVAPGTLVAQKPDTLYSLEVRLNVERVAAVDSVLAALPRASFAPGLVQAPYLILASPLDRAGTTVRIQLLPDGTGTRLILSAIGVEGVSGSGFTMGGTGSSSTSGGGVRSVERGSRAGGIAWTRMENLHRVLQQMSR